MQTEPDDATTLREFIVKHFDWEELQTLCQDLGVDFDSLRGEGKKGKARELVAYMERHARLDDLIAVLKEKRATVWQSLELAEKSTPQPEEGESGMITTEERAFLEREEVPVSAPPPPPEGQPLPTAQPPASTALDQWRSLTVQERVAIISLVGTIAAAFITLCGMLGGPVIEEWAKSRYPSPTAIAIATPMTTLTSTVTPSPTSTRTPAPTTTHPSTLTPMPSDEVVIEIDGVVIGSSDDRCQEVDCSSSPRIEVVKVPNWAGVPLQPNICSYNWRFDPPDPHNPDRLDSKNYAIIYSVPCDLNNQTATIEVLKDGETLGVRRICFNIK